MNNIKGKVTACCLAFVMAGTPLILSGCNNDKKIVCEIEDAVDVGFDKFSEDISDIVSYVGSNYEYGDTHDAVLSAIISQSSFKGIDNPLTLAFLKQYIVEKGLIIEFDSTFMDKDTGNITIETSLGKLSYSSSTFDGGKRVSADVSSKMVFDETKYEQNIFDYSAGCEVVFELTKKGNTPKKVKISAGYTTKTDENIPNLESNNYNEYIFCEDGYDVITSKDGEISLKHKYGTVEEYDNDHIGKVALSTIDESEVHTGLVTNLFLTGAPTSAAINVISKTRSSYTKNY